MSRRMRRLLAARRAGEGLHGTDGAADRATASGDVPEVTVRLPSAPTTDDPGDIPEVTEPLLLDDSDIPEITDTMPMAAERPNRDIDEGAGEGIDPGTEDHVHPGTGGGSDGRADDPTSPDRAHDPARPASAPGPAAPSDAPLSANAGQVAAAAPARDLSPPSGGGAAAERQRPVADDAPAPPSAMGPATGWPAAIATLAGSLRPRRAAPDEPIPTLTEVFLAPRPPLQPASADAVPTAPSPHPMEAAQAAPAATAGPGAAASPDPNPDPDAAAARLPGALAEVDWGRLADRVRADVANRLLHRSDALIEGQLAATLKPVLDRAIGVLAIELQDALNRMIRELVARAVAEELTRLQDEIAHRNPSPDPR